MGNKLPNCFNCYRKLTKKEINFFNQERRSSKFCDRCVRFYGLLEQIKILKEKFNLLGGNLDYMEELIFYEMNKRKEDKLK